MKSLLLLIVLGVLSVQADIQLDEEHVEHVRNHREVCSKKSNVDPMLLEKARKGEFSDNADFRYHVFCVSQEIGYIDDSGKVLRDVLKLKTTEIFNDKADEIIEMCLSKSEDPIQLAIETMKCYYDKKGLVLL
ncbi:uncharacterized protein LOC108906314 [Anoplophora glabripennis]|uniref:uncharacterized protein LOC108906314 n=1 Tax=Anoplophora glabripennis TaxID=217634 RepID=UPI000873B3F0|nr:uncharacterized protein LOC108906314 [Anoplophora glabripennis]